MRGVEQQERGAGVGSVQLARNAFHLLLGQAGTMVLGILFSSIVGRPEGLGVKGLGPVDFGLFFLLNSFASFAMVLVDWGQQYFGIREVARAPERGGDLLGTGLVIRGFGMVAICGPAAIAAWALGYDGRTRWFTTAVVLTSLPYFLAQGFGIAFRGRDRMELDAAVSVANRAVGLLCAWLALYFGLGLPGVLGAMAVGGLAALALAFRLYPRLDGSGPLRLSPATARFVLRGGTPLFLMSLAVYVQPYLDAVLLSKMVPAEVLGWYGAAKSIMGTLLAPALIIGSAAFPRLSRAASSPVAFRDELATALRPVLWLGGLAAVGTWLFAATAIQVVYGGKHYDPATVILQVHGLGLVLLFLDVLLACSLTALGRSTAMAVGKIVSVAGGVGLELFLIPHFQRTSGNGGIGVTLATVLAELVVFAGYLLLLPRGALSRRVVLDALRTVGTAFATWGVFRLLPPLSPWIGIPLCVVLFAVLSAAVGFLRPADLRVLPALLRSKVGAESGAALAGSGGPRE
jgi:O-antigen/teichoic acid export membrane protein